MRDVISIRDFSREDLDHLIAKAIRLKTNREPLRKVESNKKVASLFFENSTRTRVSSETAAMNCGYFVNGFAGVEGTSVKKGEPLLDTLRMFEGYDYKAIFMRHPLSGSARFAADNLDIPIINGGDGSNSHPTQTLLDLMTIYEKSGTIDGLKIALVGDLQYGRTVHSMLHALELYDVQIYLVSPPNLQMANWRISDYQRATGRKVIISEDLQKTIDEVDVLYMTRIQRERFPEGVDGEIEFKKVSGIYKLKASMLHNCKQSLSVLHPLPRYKHNLEIDMDVDRTPYALYFEQARNGLFMREAILESVMHEGFKGRQHYETEECDHFDELSIVNGNKKGEKLIYRLDSGTLIDHIDQGKGLEVYRQLGLEKWSESEVMVACNIRSKKQGRKDVIAVHERKLKSAELSRIALISENHTINFIENCEVVRKGKVLLPNVIRDFIKCPNHGCISREEHHEFATSLFYLHGRSPLEMRCHYCEQIIGRNQIELYN